MHLRIGVSLVEGGGHGTAVCAGVGETASGRQVTGQLAVRVQSQVVILKFKFS